MAFNLTDKMVNDDANSTLIVDALTLLFGGSIKAVQTFDMTIKVR